MDRIIIIVCAILFVIVGGILIWWLKIGKQHFIQKRCLERLQKSDNEKENKE
jgi:hypothetical protein